MDDLIVGAGIVALLYVIGKKKAAAATQAIPNNSGAAATANIPNTITYGGAGLDTIGGNVPSYDRPLLSYQPSGGDVFDWLEQWAYAEAQQAESYRQQYPVSPDVIVVQSEANS
jgi:hypothetical protein